MTYAIRVKEDYVGLMGRYVAEGQAIVPGAPIMDIMTPEGIVETVLSEGWGIVAHIEGGRIFSKLHEDDERDEGDDEDDEDDGESGESRSSSGGASIVFYKGDVICHIVARQDRNQRAGDLRPRNQQSVSFRRMHGIAPR